MKVKKKALWESGGSLQRFGALKLKGKSLVWKAGRIHKAASKVVEDLQREQTETLIHYGAVEVERFTPRGPIQVLDIVAPTKPTAENKISESEYKDALLAHKENQKSYRESWERILKDDVEIWGDPFSPDELGDEFWGKEEVRGADGKIISPAIPGMMIPEDIGALGEWMIEGEATEEKVHAPVENIADHQKKEAVA